MKTFEVKIIARFPNIEKGREIPEILKRPFRTLLIDADSESDAVAKVRWEMVNTTYKQFFPDLNDRADSIWFETWSVQHLFPENYIYEEGQKILSDWSEKEIIKMSESFIGADIFERIQIETNELKKEKPCNSLSEAIMSWL